MKKYKERMSATISVKVECNHDVKLERLFFIADEKDIKIPIRNSIMQETRDIFNNDFIPDKIEFGILNLKRIG